MRSTYREGFAVFGALENRWFVEIHPKRGILTIGRK
jgi:hypothetical protein